jgi:hypothetical protein
MAASKSEWEDENPPSLLRIVINEEWRVLGEQDCQMKWGSLEKRNIVERQLRGS